MSWWVFQLGLSYVEGMLRSKTGQVVAVFCAIGAVGPRERGKAIVMGSDTNSVNIDFLPYCLAETQRVLSSTGVQEFHLDELLTHEISLQDIDKAFELLEQPDCVKVVVKNSVIFKHVLQPQQEQPFQSILQIEH
ncbi:8-hydroxygeraniol oxidoreductase-like [Jatropha curcas]|uniref:8-hydroxygeraniol oxidoreductase-like n=1 Tax=Jatropha curcas TaxID=180498 RepID=UPI00189328AE|nr:8-hydroxygeraniol oxidoreductase-like [Jatropha curcas]